MNNNETTTTRDAVISFTDSLQGYAHGKAADDFLQSVTAKSLQ